MKWYIEHSWLIPVLPFISFVFLSLFVRARSAALTAYLATASVFCSCALAWILALDFISRGDLEPSVPFSFEWLRFQPNLSVSVGMLIDPLSVLLLIVVTTVSALVHFYSLGYMAHEEGKGRFFVFLNLFTFSMLGLVCAPNIVQMFVCWELVGASSFLLIGFYYQKASAVAASKKAFIVTRFADLGFLLGIFILGAYGFSLFASPGLQPFDFAYLSSPQFLDQFSLVQSPIFHLSMLTLALLLVFMGAAGKSAMFPLHVWLPDAMEGPTPVSALIHAATMVVAGVYLVARLFPLFAYSETALMVVAVIGAFTCLFAAVIGCTQDDLKRVLAFSTLSQLGYMMFSLGVASPEHPLGYSASMFHLFTHAFFKAQLFLCAGILIHAAHTNSVWEMGGLARKMPVTHLVFLIAVLAISGIYPFAGFFSKDEILLSALQSGHAIIFYTALFVAGLTAFYMSRIYFLVFWGTSTNHHTEHVHAVSLFELLPVLVLSVFSIGAGFVPIGSYVHFGHHASHAVHDSFVPMAGTIAAVLGIFSAWMLYTGEGKLREAATSAMGGAYTAIRNKFYIDEVYLFVVHKVIFRFISAPFAWIDRNIVDGGVNFSGWCVRAAGGRVSRLESGQLQTYGSWIVHGLLVLILFFWIVWH